MASKKKAKTKKVFVLHDGTSFDVTGEDGKFFYCGKTQFRRGSRLGEIREVELSGKAEEAEPKASEAQTDTMSAEAETE